MSDATASGLQLVTPTPTGPPIQVAVLDSCEMVTAGLASLMTSHGDRVRVLAPARSAYVPRLADVLLLDVSGSRSGSGSGSGSVGLSDVLRAQGLPVLLFDWSENEQQLVADSLAGACGFVFKDAPAAAIVAAVESAFRGEDRSTTRTPHLRSVGRLPEPVKELSPREAEILALIADGRSNVEIAEQLFLSINSVKTYIRKAYRKIGVSRRTQAVAWGLTHDLTCEKISS